MSVKKPIIPPPHHSITLD
uniref:Uncharacterized protein n=1 Tax=Rhizophora mucronata TaxID=61149 RepID=A0A2P2IYE3_RHIMU